MLSKYRYCKSRMVAFVDGELPLKARRRVARYIDESPKCYAEYVRVRELKRDLSRELPTFGQPNATQLDRVWSKVAARLDGSNQKPLSPMYLRYRTSYSAAFIVLVLAMLLPLAMQSNPAARASTTPPVPTIEKVAAASTDVAENVRIVAVTTVAAMETDTIMTKATRLNPQAAPRGTPTAGGEN